MKTINSNIGGFFMKNLQKRNPDRFLKPIRIKLNIFIQNQNKVISDTFINQDIKRLYRKKFFSYNLFIEVPFKSF